MQRKEIDSTFFRVKRVSCYAEISKNNKIFSNYAIVNVDDGKIISAIPDSYKFISNEELVTKISEVTGLKSSYVFTDNKTFYYFTVFPHLPTSLDWHGYELINSYDGHARRKCCQVFFTRDGIIFTDIEIIDAYNMKSLVPYNHGTNILSILGRKNGKLIPIIPDSSPLIPQKLAGLIPLTANIRENRAEALFQFAPLISKWMETNFLNARKFSVGLFNYYFNSK